MSYSFSVRGADKASVRASISAELDKVVAQQPIHAADRAQAEANANGVIDVIPEPSAGEEISATVNGYVQWRGVLNGEPPATIIGANINASASIVAKPTAG